MIHSQDDLGLLDMPKRGTIRGASELPLIVLLQTENSQKEPSGLISGYPDADKLVCLFGLAGS